MQTDLDHPASPENVGRNSDRMMQLITGHWMAQIVRAVAHYAIADETFSVRACPLIARACHLFSVA